MTEGSSPAQRHPVHRLQRLFLFLGIGLLTIYSVALIHGAVFSRVALWAFSAVDKPHFGQPAPPGAATIVDKFHFGLWNPKRIVAYKASLASKMERPEAVLSIHRLQLEAPIFEGTDDITLNRGLGRIAGTARLGEDGNVGIAGHRDGFFRVLKDIAQGDSIEIATAQGQDLYVVDSIDIVDPSNVSVLQPGGNAAITLVTCYPFYYVGDAPHRYIVHASLKFRQLQPESPTIAASTLQMQKEK